MKVVVVADYVVGVAEGSSIVARDLVRALPAAGVGTAVVTLDRRVPSFRALRELRRVHADAAIYIPRSGLTNAALLRARLLSAIVSPLVVEIVQADAVPAQVSAWLRPRLVVFPSERLAVTAGAGLKSAVVPIGIDCERFTPAGAASGVLWPEREGPRMLHVGHVRPSRNLSPLTELARRGANVLLVASPDTQQDPEERRRLDEAGVTVHRQRVEDLPAVYRAADVYVFPVTDPRGCIEVPLSVLEALACGTPVVATPFGALQEFNIPGLIVVDALDVVDSALAAATAPPVVDAVAVPSVHAHAAKLASALERLASPKRPRRLVVLLGVDGTGKSTQAQLLREEAQARGIDAVAVWSRWNPLILRPFMATVRRMSATNGDTRAQAYERQLSLKRRFSRVAAVRAVWEWLASFDHGIQTIPRVAVARRSAELVIADRYYHDALVDMGANYGMQPPRPRGLFRLFPKPDDVILLDAPEEVVFGRKHDVPSVDYLRHRRSLYLELAKRHGWPVVDATQSAEDVHAEVAGIIWSTP